jgi:hypothetical protein
MLLWLTDACAGACKSLLLPEPLSGFLTSNFAEHSPAADAAHQARWAKLSSPEALARVQPRVVTPEILGAAQSLLQHALELQQLWAAGEAEDDDEQELEGSWQRKPRAAETRATLAVRGSSCVHCPPSLSPVQAARKAAEQRGRAARSVQPGVGLPSMALLSSWLQTLHRLFLFHREFRDVCMKVRTPARHEGPVRARVVTALRPVQSSSFMEQLCIAAMTTLNWRTLAAEGWVPASRHLEPPRARRSSGGSLSPGASALRKSPASAASLSGSADVEAAGVWLGRVFAPPLASPHLQFLLDVLLHVCVTDKRAAELWSVVLHCAPMVAEPAPPSMARSPSSGEERSAGSETAASRGRQALVTRLVQALATRLLGASEAM